MLDHINALIAGHGIVSMGATFAFGIFVKHYLPQVVSYIATTGTDIVVQKAWAEMKVLLAKAGATDAEIKKVEETVISIALRASQDLEKEKP